VLLKPTTHTERPALKQMRGFRVQTKNTTIMINKIKQLLLDNAGPIFFTIAMSIGLFLIGMLFGAIDQWLTPDLPIQYR
jgi:hypothetical protein